MLKPFTRIIFLTACFLFGKALMAQNEGFTIGSIGIKGNHHTKEFIIYRELTFREGDVFDSIRLAGALEVSKRNLLNTGLFNFVTLNIVKPDTSTKLEISIALQERWYVWPQPVLEITDRNFNSWWLTHDFTRINYGMGVAWNNFSGRLDVLRGKVQAGKNREYTLGYFRPYVDKAKKFGLGLSAGYAVYTEVGARTQDDKLEYLFTGDKLMDSKWAEAAFTFRQGFYISHTLTLGWYHRSFGDSLLAFNPDYTLNASRQSQYVALHYKIKFDFRDIHYYPLKGWYYDVELSQSGLGLPFEKSANIGWLKSTSRFYQPLSRRWFSGFSFMGKVSTRAYQPYLFMQGLGYGREFVRGYQYNVVDGKHFLVFKSTVKYCLVEPQNFTLKSLDLPRFTRFHYALYLTAFADAGKVWYGQSGQAADNLLPGTMLYAAGTGLDFVTYYDKVFRVEYTINKAGQRGIFLHFIAGI